MVGLGVESVDWCPEAAKGVNGLDSFQREIPMSPMREGSGEKSRRRPKVGETHVVSGDGLRTAIFHACDIIATGDLQCVSQASHQERSWFNTYNDRRW